MTSLDFNELTSDLSFTKAKTGADRTVDEYSFEPTNFEEMRRGSWDIHARIADMDLNGVYASLNFPSFLPGFAGQRMQTVTKDLDLALASIRAWNDWHIEAWAGP